jgi:TPP-dependent pyruvate/acetoin dehydrogenase alpha subunit
MTSGATTLLDRYRRMYAMRRFEEACAEGVTTGELRGELHLAVGQEAIAAGMAQHLRPGDWVVSTHRSHLHAIAKGVPLLPLMAEVYEKRTGLSGGKGGHLHLFDPEHRFSSTGIVGSSIPVALGHAYAARLAGTDDVAVGITGDGGVNTGQFHESLNMASLWKLPLVLLVENNLYAISVPATEAIAGPGIAERAGAYGVSGLRVDGTDVEAFADAFGDAVARARRGDGPALLEATCHRFRGHYEGDTDHYRTEAEKREMVERGDPLAIARARILERGDADEARLTAVEDETRAEIRSLLETVRAAPDPSPDEALTDVFASP